MALILRLVKGSPLTFIETDNNFSQLANWESGVHTGQLLLTASTTNKASLRIPHGSAPTFPVNGDMWTTSTGLYIRINGSTIGPLGTGGGGDSGVTSFNTRTGAVTLSSLDVTNALGYTPVNRAGDTFLGKLIAVASSSSTASIRLPHGSAPTSPIDGDMWSTSAGLFVRISGTTVGPLGTGGGGSYLPLSGGTLTGLLTTAASTTSAAGLRLPHGSAPTSPVNGDMWTTTSGVYARINGVTKGPFLDTIGGTYLPLTGGTLTGDLGFSGSGRRITGDFSNGTIFNRLIMQTSTANGATNLTIMPNGTGTSGGVLLVGITDIVNSPYSAFSISSTEAVWDSAHFGAGSTKPINIKIDGIPALTINAARQITIGNTAPNIGEMLGVKSADLGTTAGNQTIQATLFSVSTNFISLVLKTRRFANGTDHSTAETKLQRRVDSTDMGYLAFQSNTPWVLGNNTTAIMSADTSNNVTCVGQITATSFNTSSSRELKTDIQPVQTGALKRVVGLARQIKEYQLKADTSRKLNVGVLAEDTPERYSDGKSVNVNNILFDLVAAIGELVHGK